MASALPAAPKDIAQTALELIHAIDAAAGEPEIVAQLSPWFSRYGYPSFLICGLPEPPARLASFILSNGMPQGWLESYEKQNCYCDDPIAAWARQSSGPFEWADVPDQLKSAPRARDVLGLAGEFGMRTGFVVPVPSFGGLVGVVAACGEKADLDPQARPFFHFVGIYAYAKALTFKTDQISKVTRRLTAREREALRWLAAGKTSWETSVLFDVSEAAVNKLIANAMDKLDAVNRTQAVVNAIRRGEIQP